MTDIISKLYIFSGLPATGKTSLAQKLSQHLGAFHLRIDTVEQALRDFCELNVQGEGYRLSYQIAQDNLVLGHDVIADSCNPISLTRKEWHKVATDSGAKFVNIEIICSDKSEHQKRVANRKSDFPNLILPTWEEIEKREYHQWQDKCIIIDTANKSLEQSFEELKAKIKGFSS